MQDITPQQFEQFLRDSTCLIPFWDDAEFYSERGKALVAEFMTYFELDSSVKSAACTASYLRAQGTSDLTRMRVLYKIDPKVQASMNRWIQEIERLNK